MCGSQMRESTGSGEGKGVSNEGKGMQTWKGSCNIGEWRRVKGTWPTWGWEGVRLGSLTKDVAPGLESWSTREVQSLCLKIHSWCAGVIANPYLVTWLVVGDGSLQTREKTGLHPDTLRVPHTPGLSLQKPGRSAGASAAPLWPLR